MVVWEGSITQVPVAEDRVLMELLNELIGS